MTKHEKTLRILLVEDSPDDEELIRLAFADAGYAPLLTRVTSRPAVEAALAETDWHLILCDHNLPGMSSLDVLRLVADRGVGAPFVILSGAIPQEEAIEAMRRGARDFINKSMLGKLIPVIERELATADIAQQLDRLTADIGQLTDFDRLTGLPNRESLLRHLAQHAQPRPGEPEPFALLLLDINRFRHIFRSLGPDVGNRVIAEVARRIATTSGPINFVARIGGDSFAVVAHRTADAHAVEAMAGRLSARVGAPLHVGGYELFIALSVGACCFPQGADNAEALFLNAEAALFNAKQAGSNSLRLFDPAMAESGPRAIALEGALHRAIRNREFVLHYQPQVELAGGRVVSVEALLRWRHPEWGLVAPGEFIPLLEETGLIVPVGEWIIDSACAQMRVWQDAGLPTVSMAVNLSALQFGDPRLHQVIADALARHAVPAEWLELEITESIVMQGKNEAIHALQALRHLGVRIAVDDFGTGYSSLGYLKRFPITTLKIDQMFVRECENSPRDQALIETMIQMGHRLDLEIVAEGVETARQAEFLASHGCEFAQGYFYGKPLAPEAMAEHLRLLSPSPRPGFRSHDDPTIMLGLEAPTTA